MTLVNSGIRDSVRDVTTSYTITYPGGGGTSSGSYLGNIVAEHSRIRSVTARLANGWRPVSPYTCFAAEVKLNPYNFKDKSNTGFTGVTDNKYGISLIVSNLQRFGTSPSGGSRKPDIPAGLLSQVLTEAMVDIGSSKANIPANVAELGKTISYLATLAKRLLQALKAVKRGDLVGVAKALGSDVTVTSKLVRYKAYKTFHSAKLGNKNRLLRKRDGSVANIGGWVGIARTERRTGGSPSQLWLELQYAILPLLGEIRGVLDYLAESSDRPLLISGKARTQIGQFLPFGYGFLCEGVSYAGAEAKVWASIRDDSIRQAGRLGVSLTGLAGGVWEAVPYSFVVDWLLPLGTILEACTARIGLDFFDGYSTIRRENDFVARRITDVKSGEAPSLVVRTICIQRVKLDKFPNPGFYLKNPFSSSHTLNAIALLTSSGTIR